MPKIVRFSGDNLINLMSLKNNARNDLVRGLLSVILESPQFDGENLKFRRILNELTGQYTNLKKQIMTDKLKGLTPDMEKRVINVDTVLQYLIREIGNEYISEINLSTYLARLVQYTNDMDQMYGHILQPQHRTSILETIRNSKYVRKILLGLTGISLFSALHMQIQNDAKGATVMSESKKIEAETARKNVEAANAKKITAEEMAAFEKSKIPVATPPGYEFMFSEDNTLVTAYTPTGKGLMAGVNPDGTPYKETGRTATNFNATNNFDGIAVDPRRIPYGSLVYIEDVGWKIADDTGAEMRNSHSRGLVHIDVRKKSYAEAIEWGEKHKKIYVFRNTSDKNYYNRVWDARKGFKNPESNLFKHITSNPQKEDMAGKPTT